ncbi:hypothetical protein mRhiFer1_008948 [Rhinolophus ferrumequinum]|uniref:Uncharacterized protein n=1 Tax=Rhinolophus ferrumequinum TaxID=59479 RepID=A0A7J7TDT9_RHIFE|nr:hypothetical protein mRhiFer1_008948 [Rhinolophus ferrumequinum]
MITEAGMSQPEQCDPETGENHSAGQPHSLASLCVSLTLSLLPGDTQCWAAKSSRSGRLRACPGERSLTTKLQWVERETKAAQALQPHGSKFKSQQLMHLPCDPEYHGSLLSLGVLIRQTGRRVLGSGDYNQVG